MAGKLTRKREIVRVNTMRLLPEDQDWIPYAWLAYLPSYTLVPFLVPSSPLERAVTVVATLTALVLYFLGYWLRDRRILWVVGGLVVMGVLLIPTNPGASVFFIYGSSFVGRVFEPAVAYRYLGAILAIIGIEALVFRLPPYAWVTAAVLVAMVGSVVTQLSQKNRLTAQLLKAQEEVHHMATVAERERIGRDLHDLLGHTLSVIILKSELASKLAAADPERATAEIRDVERISREALAQVRSAVQGYRSGGIERELAEARRTLETAGIRIEEAIEPRRLSPVQEGVFAMALREGITNVVRHAQATVCRLTLRHAGNWCEMEIADNGRGGAVEEGNGLTGMRQRVEALGGVLERNGSSGTQLRIRVPV
jgi:two-component system sensor histidine kinase DesK